MTIKLSPKIEQKLGELKELVAQRQYCFYSWSSFMNDLLKDYCINHPEFKQVIHPTKLILREMLDEDEYHKIVTVYEDGLCTRQDVERGFKTLYGDRKDWPKHCFVEVPIDENE